MKWLLVTTAARSANKLDSNVGDEFVVVGVRRLIESVDKDAECILFDKEVPQNWDKDKEPSRNFVVICGMPLFWSFAGENNMDCWWWDYMWSGWMTATPRNVLALGIGHVVLNNRVENCNRYQEGMAQVFRRCWKVVSREFITDGDPRIVQSICPSAWCLMGTAQQKTLRLCNLMPGGGHFGYCCEHGRLWDAERAGPVSSILKDAGFLFVAHTLAESDYAKRLGWKDDRIRLFNSAQEYLDLYGQAVCYFGNRMHGAAVAASTGAHVWGATHDSRLNMVRRLGGLATTVDAVTPAALNNWIHNPPKTQTLDGFYPHEQWRRCRELLRDFVLQ